MKSRTDIIKEHYGEHFDHLQRFIDMRTGMCECNEQTIVSEKHFSRETGVSLILRENKPDLWAPNTGLRTLLRNKMWKPISEFPAQHYGGYYELIGKDQKVYILYVTEHLKPVLDKQWLMFKQVTLSALPNFYLDE